MANITDMDGDRQEEMLFVDKETSQPIILRGKNEFSLVSSSRSERY